MNLKKKVFVFNLIVTHGLTLLLWLPNQNSCQMITDHNKPNSDIHIHQTKPIKIYNTALWKSNGKYGNLCCYIFIYFILYVMFWFTFAIYSSLQSVTNILLVKFHCTLIPDCQIHYLRVQDCSNPIANVLQLLQCCTKPWIYGVFTIKSTRVCTIILKTSCFVTHCMSFSCVVEDVFIYPLKWFN